MKKIITLMLLLVVAMTSVTMNDARTKRRGRTKAKTEQTAGLTALERKVVGRHMLSLQWISWDYFGSVEIKKQADGTLTCKGEQLSRENDDYLKLDGTITIVDEKHLTFTGDIAMKVYHINNGEECLRQGTYEFIASGNRKYWRMQPITNPCDECADYVDIYFK